MLPIRLIFRQLFSVINKTGMLLIFNKVKHKFENIYRNYLQFLKTFDKVQHQYKTIYIKSYICICYNHIYNLKPHISNHIYI